MRHTCRALAAPAALLLTVGQGTCRGLGDTRSVLYIAVGMNAFHAALDPVLIYRAGWGVSGAGAATVVAEWGAAAAYGLVLWRRRDELGAQFLRPCILKFFRRKPRLEGPYRSKTVALRAHVLDNTPYSPFDPLGTEARLRFSKFPRVEAFVI